MDATRQWTVSLEGGEHSVSVGPDNPMTGWPKTFSCNGREYPIKIAFKRGRRFEFPFPIGQHSGVLVMSKAARPPYLRSRLLWPVCGGADSRDRSMACRLLGHGSLSCWLMDSPSPLDRMHLPAGTVSGR